MSEPIKKYENLIEMAFRFIERGPALRHSSHLYDVIPFNNLKSAVDALRAYRATGEPIFVLRGHDWVAPRAIMAWGRFTSTDSALLGPFEHASKMADEMLEWQEKHPDLVKMPD